MDIILSSKKLGSSMTTYILSMKAVGCPQDVVRYVIGYVIRCIASGNLSGMDLRGLNFSYMDFSYMDLSHAICSHTNLTGATFVRANLTGVNFAGSKLSYSKFADAELSWANLTGCVLDFADFSCANVYGVNLCNTDLTDTINYDVKKRGVSGTCTIS